MLEMAKHNLAVMLGLLCLLAAIWATGTASDVLQETFKIKGSADYLRGMYSMIDAKKYHYFTEFTPMLGEAIMDGHMTDVIRQKMINKCLKMSYWCNDRSLSTPALCEWHQRNCRSKIEERQEFNPMLFQKDDYVEKFMWAFIEIGNVDGRCDDRDQWEMFLSANKEWVSEKYVVTVIYVNHFGRKKLKQCAPKAVDFLLELPKNVTEDLDEFFKTLFHLPPDASDLQLHEKLNHTNLLKDELDFAATLELPAVIQTVRDEFKMSNTEYKPWNGRGVAAFIHRKCKNLAESLNGMLDVILLSEDSEMKSKLDDKVMKWIEYDHACWYLVKYEKKFIPHVDRLLGNQSALRKIVDRMTGHGSRASGNREKGPSRADVDEQAALAPTE
jgi:hypothetical protein